MLLFVGSNHPGSRNPIEYRHLAIHKDQIPILLNGHTISHLAVLGNLDIETESLQKKPNHTLIYGIVFND